MAFRWEHGWDSSHNNNGATQEEITTICGTADSPNASGDSTFRAALASASDSVSIAKGIHQERGDSFPHITADYNGHRWHVNLVETAGGGRAGYRVGHCGR